MRILVLYMPVIHRGYLDLIDRAKPHVIALLSEEVLQTLPTTLAYVAKKDILRALTGTEMQLALAALVEPAGIAVEVWNARHLRSVGRQSEILMPDEDISKAVVEEYFGGTESIAIIAPPTRLRYHRGNVEEKKLLVPDRRIPLSSLDREMMSFATNVSERSPDWWLQVGGVLLTRDGRLIAAYNEHQPHEHIAATFGDPRSLYKSGVRTDLSYSDHAEHILVGEAARTKFGTDDSTLYLTTFPCLPCSRLVVRAGVKRLFYRDPSYGLLDADVYLRMKRVELIEVSE